MSPTLLAWFDRAIFILAGLVDIIPGKIDDFALSLLKFLRNDPIFGTWLEASDPPAPNAITAPPAALLEAMRRWQTETQPALGDGSYMELLGYIMQIITWLQRKKGQPAPQ